MLFKQCDYEEVSIYELEEFSDIQEPDTLQENCEQLLKSILWELDINCLPQPAFPDPRERLAKSLKYVRKTFPVTPKFINFNKSKMAKHPDIEKVDVTIFKSMFDMQFELNTDEACRLYLEKIRWNGIPICPHCGSQNRDHYHVATRGVHVGDRKCKDCRSRFSVKVGTIFEKSPIPLRKWFAAIYEFNSDKKGTSSLALHRKIGVTQKTAWFMQQRIRNAVALKSDFLFEGPTQMDETYIGGKEKNKVKSKRVKGTQGRSMKTKAAVAGMVCDGLVYAKVVEDVTKETLQGMIREKVAPGSIVITDGFSSYAGLHWDYNHKVIRHNRNIFKQDGYHTNSIEGFWSLLKRGIFGVYHSVSYKHLQLYCDEFVYRYNIRHMTMGQQFVTLLANSDEKLTYKNLTANPI